MANRQHVATCTICEATCGILVETNGREVVSVRGDENDSFSMGHICPKAVGLCELQNDPDRLRKPMRKNAAGVFEEIGWDEAYDFAAAGLAEIRSAGGNDAVAFYRGNPGVHDFATLLGANVINRALGSKNVFSAGPTDTWPRYVQSASMYGGPLRATVPDIDRTDYMLIIGANPVVSNGSLMTAPAVGKRLRAIQERGGRVVVIDPRRTETAAKADEHHFIVPGSDAAFLLAMVHVLFAENLVDLGRCDEFSVGLDDVERAAADYSPERIAEVCGISAGDIRRLAREFAAAESAVAYGRMGTCVQRFGTLASWGVDLLSILTGNLDRPGGAMFTNPATPLHAVLEGGAPMEFGRWQSRVSGCDEILGEFPATVLAEEIEADGEGQVRGLITVAGNPVRTYPNSERLEDAFASLSFMVSLDYYINETTRHADVIIPPTGPLERSHYDLALNHFAVRNHARWSDPVFEAEDDTRDAWTSSLELARRLMGFESVPLEDFDGLVLSQLVQIVHSGSPHKDSVSAEAAVADVSAEPGADRVIDAMLKLGPHGGGFGDGEGIDIDTLRDAGGAIDLGALEPMLPGHLNTASGKVELAPERIVRDLPRLAEWVDEASGPGLRMINRRDSRSMNSWLHNLPATSKGRDRCTLQIHPEDAARRGIEAGSLVLVKSATGELTVPAEITCDVMRGVVCMPHGFGHDADDAKLSLAGRQPGANVNAVTDDGERDGPSGAAMLFGGTVEVEAAP